MLTKTVIPPDGFEAPGIEEFFYDPVLLGGTPFAINRIVLMMLLMTGILCLVFGLGFRRPQVVPRGLQNLLETGTEFVRVQIAEEVIGHDAAKRFAPYLTALFFFIFAFNITSVLPLLNLPINGVIAMPLIYALVTWVLYNYHGVKAQGAGHYIKGSLFPPGIPGPIYILVTPIEFISTFILRPLTLTIRLLANMLAGHLILSLLAILAMSVWAAHPKFVALPFVIVIGMAITGFEIFVGFLQAFIFTILTALYIGGAVHPQH